MTIYPPDGEYPLEKEHSEHYGPELILFVQRGEAYVDYPGGFTEIKDADLAEAAGLALMRWAFCKRQRDIIDWLAAEQQHQKDLHRLAVYNKGRETKEKP